MIIRNTKRTTTLRSSSLKIAGSMLVTINDVGRSSSFKSSRDDCSEATALYKSFLSSSKLGSPSTSFTMISRSSSSFCSSTIARCRYARSTVVLESSRLHSTPCRLSAERRSYRDGREGEDYGRRCFRITRIITRCSFNDPHRTSFKMYNPSGINLTTVTNSGCRRAASQSSGIRRANCETYFCIYYYRWD